MPKSQPDKQKKNTPKTAWKPGESGNPNGRPPKGYSITETMKAMLGEKPEIKDALGRKVLEMALKGDIAALKLVWQYMDGMPKQEVDITTPTTVTINHVHTNNHDTTDEQAG